VVYLEHTTSDVYVEEPKAIQSYNQAFKQHTDKALSPEASVRFIGEIAEDL
jgi:hypothetical protein